MITHKNITAAFIAGDHLAMDNLSAVMDCLDQHPIAEVPWPVFPFRPEVYFAIAYSERSLYLKFYVFEEGIQARYRNTNDPVYRDSCVECFLALNGEKAYYNFEFNCLGTCLAEYGTGRIGRTRLPTAAIASIRRQAELVNRASVRNGKTSWNLTIVLPVEAFVMHSLGSFKGIDVRANFYKCGDDLPLPHYLSWNLIHTPEPDFHVPASFGDVILA